MKKLTPFLFGVIVAFGTFAETTITLTAPADGAVYDTHLQALEKYLSNSDARSEFPDDDLIKARDDKDGNHYVLNAWFTNLLVEASQEYANKPFTWITTGDITDIIVQYSEDAEFSEGKVLNEKYCRDNATCTRPLNLKLATKYWWRVKALDTDGAEVVSDVRTFTTEGKAPRIIGTLGFNMRDLGGGTNADGVVVRQGLLFRGQAPMARVNGEAGWNDQKSTEASYREFYLDKHHIKTELDLRSASEALEHQTQYDEIEISTIGITHYNYEIYPYHVDHDLTRKGIRNGLRMLAEGTHYPVYFNCAVGSDRTGTFAVMIDGILGRDDQWFYDNYELPSFNSGLARLRYNRKASEMFAWLQPRNPGEHFRDRVIQYVLGLGITRDEIRSIRAAMLDFPGGVDPLELKNAKAVYTEANQTLTLRYDALDYSGVVGQSQLGVSRGSWAYLTNDVRHIVFDSSFAGYRVESCLQWFENFKYVQDVSGMTNFNTAIVTTLRGMFSGCSSLTCLDFSGHDFSKCANIGNLFYKCTSLKWADFTDVDTGKVSDFYRMFSGCSAVTNIYASTTFVTTNYMDTTKEVFKSCTKLVGGAGTKYDSVNAKTNNYFCSIIYAHIDGGVSNPGFFTERGAAPIDPPVVDPDPPVVDPDPPSDLWADPDEDQPEDTTLAARAVRIGGTIRFYYDQKSHTNNPAAVVSVIPVAGTRTWLNPSEDNFEITNVIFYASFKGFQPTSMSSWFSYYRALKNVVGLNNIDTSEVKNMSSLFRCKSGNNGNITELDLSTWNMRKCTNTSYMFARLSGVKTIYVGDDFVMTQVTSSSTMFDRCNSLVGEQETKFVDGTTPEDKTYAKVDGGKDDPGLFTYKAPPVESQSGAIFYLF